MCSSAVRSEGLHTETDGARLGLQTDLKEGIGAVWTLMAEESTAEESA